MKTTEKLDRQKAFWRRENHDRPVIGFTGGYFAEETLAMLDRAEGELHPEDINVQRVLELNDQQIDAWEDCTGDMVWPANALVNFRWFPAILGAKAMIGGDSVWVEPSITSYDDIESLAIDESSEWLQAFWGLTDALVKHAAGRFSVAGNYIMAPLTLLAELRGSTQLAFDLYDYPDGVKRAMNRLTECWGQLVL